MPVLASVGSAEADGEATMPAFEPEPRGNRVAAPGNGVPLAAAGEAVGDVPTALVAVGAAVVPGGGAVPELGRGVARGVGRRVAAGAEAPGLTVAVGIGVGFAVGTGVGGGGDGVGCGVGGAVTTTVGPGRSVGSTPWLIASNVTGHEPAGRLALPRNVPSSGVPFSRVSMTVSPATDAQTRVASCPFVLV